MLPAKFKFNHTGYAEVRFDAEIENRDYGSQAMEGARSEDILPLLKQNFTCHAFVPFMCLSRRFFNTMYGPNYDLSQDLDRSIVEFIWRLEVYYVSHGILKPETMFGVYGK